MGQQANRGASVTLWAAIASAVVGSSGGAARAAEATEATTETGSDAQLTEVTVTAQRRSENLQSVPISAQVVSGRSLADQNLSNLNDLSLTVPAIHVSAGGATSDMYIRGIGSGNQQSFDQSVGTFIDDIYHGRARSSTSTFLDLDRIEVLKGPQSTFFGNNAIAGALNIVTRQPTNTFTADARALYGQDGQYALESGVNVPVSDILAVRVAGIVDGQSGWIRNFTTGEYGPKTYNDGGRLSVALHPSDDFDATFKIEGSANRESGDLDLQQVDCPPPAPFKTGPFCQAALSQGVPTYTVGHLGDVTGSAPGQGTYLSTFESELTLNYHRWDQTFTSVTGWYRYNYNQDLDLSGTPTAGATAQAPEQFHQFSQEFRVASPNDGPIEYMAGLYAQIDRLDYQQYVNYPVFTPKLAAAPPFAALVPYLPVAEAYLFSQPEHLYSVFGSVTWHATDALSLSAGLRGSSNEKTYQRTFAYGSAQATYGGFVPLPASLASLPQAVFGIPPGQLSGRRKDKDWMPSVKVQYQLDPRAMLYGSFSQGFKAGGFNGSDTTGIAANVPYEPEHVNAFEVGLKSEWLNDTLLLNVDAFRSNYRNLQVVVEEGYQTGTGVAVVRNAAASQSQGIELEGTWVASSAFRLSTNLTYLDSHYIDYANAAPAAIQQVAGETAQDLSGRPTEYAPKFSGSVTAAYTAHLPAGLHLTASLIPFFTSKYYLLASEDAAGRQSSYVRLDARLSLETDDGHWGFDIIGKNLTDREILVYSTIEPTSPGSYLVSQAQGSNVAAQVRFHW